MDKSEIPLYLFGTNSLARILVEFLRGDSRYCVKGFTLDGEFCTAESFIGLPIIPLENLAEQNGGYGVINCVGYSMQLSIRAEIDARIREKELPLLSYFHPRAELNGVDFGEGNLVMNQVVIEPYSVVGNGNIFYGGSYICHDAEVCNYNWFSSGVVLAGEVTVGSHSFFGINSSIREKLTIGSMVTVGMGAVVTRDVPDNVIVTGNPARVRKTAKE